MALEDFEKALAEEQAARTSSHDHQRLRSEGDKDSRRYDRHHHRRHHRSSKDEDKDERRSHRHKHDKSDKTYGDGDERHEDEGHRRRHKRPRDGSSPSRRQRRKEDSDRKGKDERSATPKDHDDDGNEGTATSRPELQRDAWMEAPSALDVEFTHRPAEKEPERKYIPACDVPDHGDALEKNDQEDEANLDWLGREYDDQDDYYFGDEGSNWRMTKLKAVYTQAEDSGRPVEEIAIERYGNLRAFDNAREEEIELERREPYGGGYFGRNGPDGHLYQERLQREADQRQRMSERREKEASSVSNLREEEERKQQTQQPGPDDGTPSGVTTVQLDQTALNRLKAQMMKAKLRGSPEHAKLEEEYIAARASFANRKESDVVVLGPMESRMLAGARRQPASQSKKPKNDDDLEGMSVADMVREERMTRGQAGGEGRRFAERIAKDGKFDDDLEYMDENASKLARRIEKSEISLKNTAVHELQKMNRILDKCPLCHHEDTNKPPLAPVVSLATRVYLTLPTTPEISQMGACIVPVQHRGNLLECDDDEWEEIRNFMKCLKRMYHDQGRDVIFYENAVAPERKRHAAMEVVPLPQGLGDTAPAFFKEAILSSSPEWTQHRKLIDTLSRSRGPQGLGKLSFRRSLVKEMPYFHVWFDLDGGVGHIVEDIHRWPKGDLFAREVLGGMLDLGPEIVRKQGRWGGAAAAEKERVEKFRKTWKEFDWTGVLTDQE